jgi:Tol biopolymer transport system component
MIGRSVAHYRITAKLGEGGMGEVYRATDSKLEREVAIKILPQSFAGDAERLARFEREAKVLASLNHPSIAAIYGVEHEEDVRALVLELVDGPTLAERLAAGRLERDEALRIACRIAEALEEAHERGIVHRDLKPANVKIAAGGKVKVLDFGLAKALDPMAGRDSAPSVLAHSPTLTLGATMQGVILGTAAYMSPEQARGSQADARADVWAFGVVLFEMLAGRSLFTGPTVSDTLASVLKVEPDLAQLPADTPGKLRRLLERCLRKDPRERLHAIADARIVIEEVLRGELDEPGAAAAVGGAPARPRWQVAAALGGALLLGGLLAAATLVGLAPAPEAKRVYRFDLEPPLGLTGVGAPKVSPDGRHVAFVARNDKGTPQIWLRSLDSATARPLAGTDGVKATGRPFWSPDSRYLAFFTPDKLLKVPIDGAPPIKVADADGADGSWSERGLIVYDSGPTDPLRAVPAAGGTPRSLIEGVAGEGGYQVAWPQFLPGGDKLLYVAFEGSEERNGIWIADADGSNSHRVVAGLSRVEFVPPGWLLFVRDSTLVAQAFDADAGELSGEPIPVADGLGVSNIGLAEFSAASDDVLAFRATAGAQEALVFYDRKGAREGEPAETGGLNQPVFSPDGRWLAFDKLGERDNRDIWLRDLRRGVSSRFTTTPGIDFGPLFSPDGEQLYYGRAESGTFKICVRPLAAGVERIVHTSNLTTIPVAIAPDGRRLVLGEFVEGNPDLVVLDLERPEALTRFTSTPEFWELRASFSPDGRWLAFQSNESGENEIYVQPFPGPGRRWQVSTAGGTFPVWGPNGREILYRDLEQRLTRVAVEAGTSFDAAVPEPLFPLVLASGNSVRRLAISPDGQRIAAVVPGGDGREAPTSIIVGWRTALPR